MPDFSHITTEQLREELTYRERVEQVRRAEEAKKFREHLRACSKEVETWPSWKKKSLTPSTDQF